MSFSRPIVLVALTALGCGLRLDAGKLRNEPVGSSAGAGAVPAAGGNAGDTSVAGSGGAVDTAGASGAAGAPVWSGPELSNLGFVLLGTAELGADGVVLTHDVPVGEVGGIAYREPVRLDLAPPLHVALGLRIETSGQPGDGIAIVLHSSPNGYGALGGGGGGIGYNGLKPCLAIEVDLAQQTPTDTPIPHLGFVSGCNNELHSALAPVTHGSPADGTDWLLTVDWDPQTSLLAASLESQQAPGQPTTLSRPTDLTGLLGNTAFVAVTAATGELRATQIVRSLELHGGGIPSLSLP